MFWSWHSAPVYISWPWLSPFRGWVVWLWHLLVNMYISLTISSCYGSMSLAIVLIWRDSGLSTLCHSCRSAWLQRVLKAFAGLAYLCSQEEVVWLWHLPINLYIWLTISCCYGSIPLAKRMIGRDGGLSNLCHSCGFACQERALETFPGPDYIHSEDWVVWLWHLLVNLYIWLTISSCYVSMPLVLGLIERDGGLSTLCNSCEFDCQQRVLKMFLHPGYLLSLLREWCSLTMTFAGKFVYIYIYIYIYILQICIYIYIYI